MALQLLRCLKDKNAVVVGEVGRRLQGLCPKPVRTGRGGGGWIPLPSGCIYTITLDVVKLTCHIT